MAATVLMMCRPASGLTRIRDIARPLGERTNKLTGHGIVVGLNGTGDGGDSLVALRPMMAMIEKMGNQALNVEELKNAKNFAYVVVTAELGRNGVRNGDKIDVQVHSVLNAKSLEGGTLLLTFLRSNNFEDDRVLAIAQGPIRISDSQNLRTGVIKGGADIEPDFFHQYIDHDDRTGRSYFTLVLNDDIASFELAKTIAEVINDETLPPDSEAKEVFAEPTAYVLDPRNIKVMIPEKQVETKAQFIARVLNLLFELPDPEACIVVNERTGTIAITGNVEIAPSIIHVNGLSIQVINPPAKPQPDRPVVTQTQWTQFDTTGAAAAKLSELIKAMDQLNVPVQQKINAIYALERTGALRAKIVKEW
jgi:flagellar P-ring protein FlgI